LKPRNLISEITPYNHLIKFGKELPSH
jgi:hypothetical protein